jgi:MoaA/NifB/PqqE/SkfB family radical SAM enzyme
MCGNVYHSLGKDAITYLAELSQPDSLFLIANRHAIPHDMNEDVFLAMAGYIDTAECLCPWMCGEPLMAKMFWKVVDRLKGRTLPGLNITTNGHLLSQRNIERLKDTPVNYVNVSIDAARPETYGRIRGARFETVLEGVRRAVKARDRYGWSEHSVGMGYTVMRENIEELPRFIKLAANLGVKHVLLDHLWIYCDSWERDFWIVRREDGSEFNYEQQQLRNRREISKEFVSKATAVAAKKRVYVSAAWENDLVLSRAEHVSLCDCPYPWHWLNVMVDGHAIPCTFARKVVGNVLEDGADAVWNGPVMRQLREDLMAGRLNPLCADKRCAYARGGENQYHQ